MRLLPVALLLLALPALAQVDARVAFLTKQLEKGKDPRARAQAALVLGATEEPEAVRPLCTGLQDTSEIVRSAVAKGLATLKEVSAIECLKAHKETDAATLVAIREAIQALESFKSRPPRLYVAFEGVKDKTGGTVPADLVKVTEERLKRRLVHSGALLAPAKESKKTAQGVLKKHGISGFRLTAEIHPWEGGGVRLALICLSYPDLALLGQVDVKAGGAAPADLLKVLVPKAIEEVAETFEWST